MSTAARDGIAQQVELYGEPLGETVRTITSTLGLSQAAVARTLGVSAPMLSQLVSGQRVKLGNPHAVQRLQAVLELVADVRGGLAHSEVGARLAAIAEQDSTTLTRPRAAAATDQGSEAVRGLLRAVASGRELAAAAVVLEGAGHGALAEVLRTYGGDDPVAAAHHYAEVQQAVRPVSPGETQR